MNERRYPMHTLPQARRSLLQAKWERHHDLITEAMFQTVRAKLEVRIREFEKRAEQH